MGTVRDSQAKSLLTYLLLRPQKSQLIFGLTNNLPPSLPVPCQLPTFSQSPKALHNLVSPSKSGSTQRLSSYWLFHPYLFYTLSISLLCTCPTHRSLLLFTIATMFGSLFSSRFFLMRHYSLLVHIPYVKLYVQKPSVSSYFVW